MLGMSMLLAACGGRTVSETEQEFSAEEQTLNEVQTVTEDVTLKWALWDWNSVYYYQPLIDAFEKKNPGVKIEAVDLGSAGTSDYVTNLATELSGSGTDFDIATIQSVPQYTTLVSKGVLEPLNTYMEQDEINTELYGGLVEQVTVNENVYELPFRSDFWVLYYNPSIFEEQGVTPPDNDITWEEYDTMAREVADTTPGQEIYGSHYHTWRSCVQCPAILDGNHTLADGVYDFTKPFYDMVVNQMNDGICRNYAELKTSSLHHSDAFGQGNTAMYYMGSWQIQDFINGINAGEHQALKDNWRIAKMPHADGVEPGSTIGTITAVSIVAASDQKDLAWEFVKFITGEEGAKIIAETGSFPAIMSDEVIDTISQMEGFPQDEQSKEALHTVNIYLEMPVSEHTTELETILNEAHDSIMTGAISIDEGIEQMNSQAKEIVSN